MSSTSQNILLDQIQELRFSTFDSLKAIQVNSRHSLTEIQDIALSQSSFGIQDAEFYILQYLEKSNYDIDSKVAKCLKSLNSRDLYLIVIEKIASSSFELTTAEKQVVSDALFFFSSNNFIESDLIQLASVSTLRTETGLGRELYKFVFKNISDSKIIEFIDFKKEEISELNPEIMINKIRLLGIAFQVGSQLAKRELIGIVESKIKIPRDIYMESLIQLGDTSIDLRMINSEHSDSSQINELKLSFLECKLLSYEENYEFENKTIRLLTMLLSTMNSIAKNYNKAQDAELEQIIVATSGLFQKSFRESSFELLSEVLKIGIHGVDTLKSKSLIVESIYRNASEQVREKLFIDFIDSAEKRYQQYLDIEGKGGSHQEDFLRLDIICLKSFYEKKDLSLSTITQLKEIINFDNYELNLRTSLALRAFLFTADNYNNLIEEFLLNSLKESCDSNYVRLASLCISKISNRKNINAYRLMTWSDNFIEAKVGIIILANSGNITDILNLKTLFLSLTSKSGMDSLEVEVDLAIEILKSLSTSSPLSEIDDIFFKAITHENKKISSYAKRVCFNQKLHSSCVKSEDFHARPEAYCKNIYRRIISGTLKSNLQIEALKRIAKEDSDDSYNLLKEIIENKFKRYSAEVVLEAKALVLALSVILQKPNKPTRSHYSSDLRISSDFLRALSESIASIQS